MEIEREVTKQKGDTCWPLEDEERKNSPTG